MLYNAAKSIDINRANERLRFLIDNKRKFELKEKKPIRSVSQNSYLHLILSWFGLEHGYTLEEVKQEIFKKIVNPTIFYDGEANGLVKIQRWRSTADLDKGEMNLAIDRFRNYSSVEAGTYLPEPSDLAHLQEIKNEIEKYNSMIYL